MKIKLTVDYRGVLTNEVYYKAGKYSVPGDMPEEYALPLLKEGRVVEVKAEVEKPKPEAKTKAGKGRKKAQGDKKLDDLSEDELREMAEEQGVNTTWNMKKETIIERLDELE